MPTLASKIQRLTRRRRLSAARAAVLAAVSALLAAAGLGCLQAEAEQANRAGETANKPGEELAQGSEQPRRPAEVMVRKAPPAGRNLREDDAEHAYWRSRYKRNRTVPPEDFAVRPKPPRNNNYGEFEQELYAGLDSQPRLPGIPGHDLMPMMGGSFGDDGVVPPWTVRRPVPKDGSFHSASPGPSNLSNPSNNGGDGAGAPRPRGSVNSANAQTVGVEQAGLMTEERFYPIEQLVFGGEFPDLDRPELYRLQPKDVISVTVRDHPEFSGKLEIQPDGTVRVPNLSDLVRLRGLTVDDAAEELRRTLQVYVVGECVVRVQANRARGGYYFVFGDVLQPGRFPMGLEPIKLSDAVLAANWEMNPARSGSSDWGDEELGPAFPAANPRGKFTAPRTADLANVQLITPHRSKPARTSHDIRQAMLGMLREDPLVRPGQIIVVPSIDPRRNASLGLDMPTSEAALFGERSSGGFSRSGGPARLPELGSGAGGGYGYGMRGAAAYGGGGEEFDPLLGNVVDYSNGGMPTGAAYYNAAALAEGDGDGATEVQVARIRRRADSSTGHNTPSKLPPAAMDCMTPVQRNMARAFEVQRDVKAREIRSDPYLNQADYYGGDYSGVAGTMGAVYETMPAPMPAAVSSSSPVVVAQTVPSVEPVVVAAPVAAKSEPSEPPASVAGDSAEDVWSIPDGYGASAPSAQYGAASGQITGTVYEDCPPPPPAARRGRRLQRRAPAAEAFETFENCDDADTGGRRLGNWKMGL